jgi:ABC-2 type transport system permease protein
MSVATAPAPTPRPAVGTTGGSGFTHLIKAEYLKIRTTNIWWLFGMFTVLGTGLTLLINILQANVYLGAHPPESDDPTSLLQHSPTVQAANIYTSGQYLGGLFVLLLAILVVTNEYYHQTATTTFLATPHRTYVVWAKFAGAVIASAFFWVIVTVVDLIVGVIYFSSKGYGNQLGEWDVQKAILLNLMIFALWAVFGIGVGVLLRSQIAAMVVSTLLYVVGSLVASIIIAILTYYYPDQTWIPGLRLVFPDQAAGIATSPVPTFEHSPPQWAGVLVLIGYGIVTGTVGTLIMRRRDVS